MFVKGGKGMKKNVEIWVTKHSKDTKMEDIESISTSVLKNPICQRRRTICDGVCEHCYADRLLHCRESLEEHLSNNMEILSSKLLTPKEAALVPISVLVARIESFGDVCNVVQARNYIRIIRAHKHTQFGIWSKNWGIWLAAFKKEGKPKNCTYVHSSMKLNAIDEINPRMKPYVDHVFTVWDKKTYDEQFRGDKKTECAGIHCLSCMKCYKKSTSYYINERLR